MSKNIHAPSHRQGIPEIILPADHLINCKHDFSASFIEGILDGKLGGLEKIVFQQCIELCQGCRIIARETAQLLGREEEFCQKFECDPPNS